MSVDVCTRVRKSLRDAHVTCFWWVACFGWTKAICCLTVNARMLQQKDINRVRSVLIAHAFLERMAPAIITGQQGVMPGSFFASPIH
jgi:hypothetical protein